MIAYNNSFKIIILCMLFLIPFIFMFRYKKD